MANTTTAATNFIFAATDSAGKRKYVESSGDNLAAARYRLEIQGYTEIDVTKDAFDAKLEQVCQSDAFDDMTLHEKMEFQRRCAKPDSGRFIAWHFIKNAGCTILILAAWVWWRARGANPWSVGSFAAYGCALGYLALVIRVQIPAKLFNQLTEARAWHRWEDVRAIVERIRSWQWFTGTLIPPFELLFSEARALAGKGDLSAALEKVKPLEHDESFDRAVYLALLASLYDIAGDVPGRIAIGEKLLKLDSKSLTALVDQAYGFAVLAHDPIRAREVLSEIDPADVKPMVQPYLDLIWGVIALDEGRPTEAEERLASAVEGWRAFTGDPLAKGFARFLQGCHATALRRLGRAEEAEAKFGEVRTFLEATNERQLLQRWSHA